MSVDPLAPEYPHNSPYAFSENKVIQFIELEGLEIAPNWRLQYQHISGEDHSKSQALEAGGLLTGLGLLFTPSAWGMANPMAAERVLATTAEVVTGADMGPTANDIIPPGTGRKVVGAVEEMLDAATPKVDDVLVGPRGGLRIPEKPKVAPKMEPITLAPNADPFAPPLEANNLRKIFGAEDIARH